VIEPFTAGRFSMVCRDASTKKARQVNPLMYNTPEEKSLYDLGERKVDFVPCMILLILNVRDEAKATASGIEIIIESSTEFI
jgi:hypothetical protein